RRSPRGWTRRATTPRSRPSCISTRRPCATDWPDCASASGGYWTTPMSDLRFKSPCDHARPLGSDEMAFDAPNFDLTERPLDQASVIITVAGEIHATTAPEFSERLNDAIADGKTGVILDLTGVEFIDSTGLSVLLNGLRRVTRSRGSMVLACA